ncbi:hypothetical protein ACMFMF_010945 [Clarireedia jacksonii]
MAPVDSAVLYSFAIVQTALEFPSCGRALKNLGFLGASASLAPRGTGEGILKGLKCVGGTIIVVEDDHLRITEMTILPLAARPALTELSPTVARIIISYLPMKPSINADPSRLLYQHIPYLVSTAISQINQTIARATTIIEIIKKWFKIDII